ncbi:MULTISPECIES: hypothetical protein [Aeromonas]|uniref:Uncharacterized protein n=2 Tax=Aeromonas TaxID=642 RepID=A0A6S5D3H7_AERVE|nr:MULTISPECIES: hypothetical protein [Aeromonas]MBL0624724.1 hypothetical protein [Aeromonas veronii]QPR54013.1 hypothetical protein I6G90_16470 [Aeromonas allosaccharophila]TNI91276.1 hypothetical protein CF120_09885 [Aeromonas allosaccharophila]BBR37593.1 hypothetical protein WP3W19E03_01180 [Aeromonas veronii]
MFKLSRKGWNNVIIVVVLIVITLLHRMETAQQENSAKRARPLLPDAAVVLTWQGPSWQIERIGQGWRSLPDLGLDTAQLDARLARWQGWLLPPGEAVRGTPVAIKVWIAGQSDPVEIGLYQNSGQYGAQLPSGLWLALTAEQYRDLLRPAP